MSAPLASFKCRATLIHVDLGYGCGMLPGVRIGEKIVVGAGPIARRNTPVPAGLIKARDEYKSATFCAGYPVKQFSADGKRYCYSECYSGAGAGLSEEPCPCTHW